MTRELSIPPERDVPAGRLERRRAHLVREIAVAGERARTRRRRLFLVLVPAVLLALAATGFTTYVLTREPTQLESIGCFEQADLEANTSIVGSDGRHPVEICAEVLRTTMGTAAPERLAACVLESGAVGVFPSSGADTCGRLGLAELPKSYAAEQKRFTELREALVARFATTCVGEDDARAAVRRELDARGYGSWQIDVEGNGFSRERPCASLAFDGEREAVILVPVEPMALACYEDRKLPSEFVLVRADGRDPVAICLEAWRDGRLGDVDRPAVACLLHGSSVGVFPGSPAVCRQLGPSVSPLAEPR